MTITVSQISALVGRFTNSVVNEQTNMNAPFVGKGKIKKINKADKVGVVNIKAGQLRSVQWIGDAGTLPSGADVQPTQATYLPIGLFGRISIPRIAAHLASSLEDGINIVQEEMESAGATLAQQLGRAIFSSGLGSPTATVTAGSTTFETTNPAAFRVGMGFEVRNGSSAIEGDTEATLLYVTRLQHGAGTGGATIVTFVGTNAGGNNTAWTTAYTFYLRGAGSSSQRMVSLGDVTADASLYSVANTSNDWSGNLDSTAQPLTLPALRDMLTLIARRRGQKPDLVVSNRKNVQRYSDLLLNNRRFAGGQKMDAVGGSSHELEGLEWFEDENVDDSDVWFFNDDDVKLHVFREPSPEFHGKAKKGMNEGAVLISDAQLIYDVQILGIYNLRVQRRNGTGRLSGING